MQGLKRDIPGISEKSDPKAEQPMSDWKSMPWAILDTETTGVDVEQDAVREIGIVWRGGWADGQEASTLVRPWKPIPAELIEKLQLTIEYLTRVEAALPFTAEFGQQLLAGVTGRLLVGYNLLRFDRPLLAAELRRVGVDPAPLLQSQAIDPFVLAAEVLEQAGSLKLEAVAATFGTACPGAHGAIPDCRMARDVLLALAPQLPAGLDELLAFQAEAAAAQAEDRERFGHWLRRSRKEPGRYRVACGKWRGSFLHEIDPGWIRWALSLPDLPARARETLAAELACWEKP
jgi:DNA polymerase III epsilon subunit-like protein